MMHTPLHIICSMEVPEGISLVKVCIESGGNPNVGDSYRRTPLHFASGTDSLDIV